MQPVNQFRVVHPTGGVVAGGIGVVGEDNLFVLNLHFFYIFFIQHIQKRAVIHTLDLRFHKAGIHEAVKQNDDQQSDAIVRKY